MRALYVPVRSRVPARLVAAALTVAATAGCMSVGDDAGRPAPSQSAGRHVDGVPGGGAAGGGGIGSFGGKSGKGGKGHKGGKASAKPGESASGDPSASASPGAKPSAKITVKSGDLSENPAPPGEEPTPTRTTAEPTPEPPPASSPAPDPGTAEPSSSAHEQPLPQLVQREPAPEAGSPV
ncbi:hypothetical protein [Streptomyces aureus]|uniref:hypothetical protein n=1 Tax=Streptomyces aureus TaxID=193461 RepID=UPI0033F1DF8C